ncbi:hypothetical protein BCR32DRAFT_328939 [Anaeromyces robustus]|uniref:Uncharacterized protein n=1 Tax=Anaeromyces robustus TaxID=1754192 RepID=A0A1Y1WV12_9FUNG|nr:hypothetical protein BCR32DRAFT_328939 [Anaeromyces robustus]|eukprot:ORX77391.1 hypothetical protein BCR32DRAFT_328939 [Anaeromyces robustus]
MRLLGFFFLLINSLLISVNCHSIDTETSPFDKRDLRHLQLGKGECSLLSFDADGYVLDWRPLWAFVCIEPHQDNNKTLFIEKWDKAGRFRVSSRGGRTVGVVCACDDNGCITAKRKQYQKNGTRCVWAKMNEEECCVKTEKAKDRKAVYECWKPGQARKNRC